jgi:hypothetical protein
MVRDAKLISRLRALYRRVRDALPGGQVANVERQLDALAQQLDDAERQLTPRPREGEPSPAPAEKRPPEPEPNAPREGEPVVTPTLKPPPKHPLCKLGKYYSHATADELRTAIRPLLKALTHGAEEGEMMQQLHAHLKQYPLLDVPQNRAFREQYMTVYKAFANPEFVEAAIVRLWVEAGRRGVSTAEALEQIVGGGRPILEIQDLTLDVMKSDSAFRDLKFAADWHGAHTHMFQEYMAQIALGGEGAGVRFRQAVAQLTGQPLVLPNGRPKPLYSVAYDALFDETSRGFINRPEDLGPLLHEHLGFPRWRSE